MDFAYVIMVRILRERLSWTIQENLLESQETHSGQSSLIIIRETSENRLGDRTQTHDPSCENGGNRAQAKNMAAFGY
jgi:hypothetical protein